MVTAVEGMTMVLTWRDERVEPPDVLIASAAETIQFSKTVFASISALMAGTREYSCGNAVITDAAHDTITIQHVTTAQLLAHQSDFHFV